MRIDLNADVGESFGPYTIGHDDGLLRVVTSASVAAGVHAGDPTVLRETIRRAKSAGVAIGAHPGLPDRAGFGRRELQITPADAENLVLFQIAAVAGVAAAEGVRLQHVKAHGALYNMAASDPDLASAIARAVRAADSRLLVFAPPDSAMARAAVDAGLRVIPEAFADRAYAADGSLVPRDQPNAVIHDVDRVSARVRQMVEQRTVTAIDGDVLPLHAETICIHSDTEGADQLAMRIRADLLAAGVTIKAVGAS